LRPRRRGHSKRERVCGGRFTGRIWRLKHLDEMAIGILHHHGMRNASTGGKFHRCAAGADDGHTQRCHAREDGVDVANKQD